MGFIHTRPSGLFTSPPPESDRIEEWAPIDELIEVFKCANHKYYIVLVEDVIIAVPEYAKQLVATYYCQEMNTQAWEKCSKRLSEFAIEHGDRLISEAVRLAGRGLRVQVKRLTSNIETGGTPG